MYVWLVSQDLVPQPDAISRPKLVTSGQTEEAVQVLQQIADHNGSAFNFALTDVDDGKPDRNARSSKDYSRLEAADEEEQPDDDYKPHQQAITGDSGWRRTLQDYSDRISRLLEPRYRTMTILVWSIWFTVSAAYTSVERDLPVATIDFEYP